MADLIATTIQQIPLEQLSESPFNHRTVFTGLDELAENIRQVGVLQPGPGAFLHRRARP